MDSPSWKSRFPLNWRPNSRGLLRSAGPTVKDLAREAIERLGDYDECFVLEVEKGLAQIDRGLTLSHEEVGVGLNRHLAGKRRPR